MSKLTVNLALPAGTPLTLNQLLQTELATRTYLTPEQKAMEIARWQNTVCGAGKLTPSGSMKLLVPWRNVTNGVVDGTFDIGDMSEGIVVDPTHPAIFEPCELSSLVLYSAGAVTVEVFLQHEHLSSGIQGLMGPAGAAGGGGGGITMAAAANVIPKSDGTNLVASQLSDDGVVITSTAGLRLPNGSAGSPAYSFTSESGTGMRLSGSLQLGLVVGGTDRARVNAAGFDMGANIISWGSGFGLADVILARDAANTLALRNGVNAQTFRIYNTYTDAANYERGNIGWTAGSFYIETAGAGTGTAKHLVLRAGAGAETYLGANALSRWVIKSAGHIFANDDNLYDIGAVANRPRNLYLAGQFLAADGTAAAPSHSFASAPNTGLYLGSPSELDITAGGTRSFAFNLSGFYVLSNAMFAAFGLAADVTISRQAAGILRVGTTAANALGTIAAGAAVIGVGMTSTAATDLLINPTTKASGLLIDAQVAGASKFSVSSTGSGVFNEDVTIGTGRVFKWTGTGSLYSPFDGVIALLNAAGTSFNRLQFGGTSNAFPALKRVGTTLELRLADDSGPAGLAVGALAMASVVIGAGVTSTGATDLLINPAVKASGNLIDAQVNGVSKFSVNYGGGASIANTLSVAGAVRAGNGQFLGFASHGGLISSADGVFRLSNNTDTDVGRLQFGGQTNAFPALKRNAAALDVRLADDSGFAALNCGALNSGVHSISVGATTSALTDLLVNPAVKASGNLMDLQVAGVTQFNVNSGGSFVSQGLGVATSGFRAGGTGQVFWSGRSVMTSPADGQILLQNAALADFNRLQFGGTSALFPALKRNATALEVRLADDSAYGPLNTGLLTVGGGGLGTSQLMLTPNSGVACGFGMANGGSVLLLFAGVTACLGVGTTNLYLRNDTKLQWGNSPNVTSTMDTTLNRSSAGVLQVGLGTPSAAGHLALTSIILQPVTVATLPVAVAGRVAYITDGDPGLAWGAVAVNSGAGATPYKVWHNGAAWTIVGK